jgi:membrane-bound lytic murein transglycosylase D
MMAQRLLALVLTLVLGACASAPAPDSDLEPRPLAAKTGVSGELLPGKRVEVAPSPPPPPADLWDRIRRQLRFHTMHNGEIAAARTHYLKQPRYLELIAPRTERYLYFLVEEVEARGLPIELALLPLVESSLNPFAVSDQRAAGLWQIMPATADYLGMRRDWWFDARLDLRQSTAFALDYLQSLHTAFDGDWLLALAAYNAGKARVSRAMKRNAARGLPTDYWSLDLPRETRHYVPRLIALSTLVAFDRALEIELPPVPNEPAFTVVATGGQVEMLRVAHLAGMDLLELRRFNPGQLRWATAPGGDDTLLLPVSRAEGAALALADLPDSQRVTWQRYRIRQGDSLIRIAKRFDTQVALLREVNNVRDNLIRAGDTLMIPDSQAWRESMALARAGTTGVKRGYKVRRGDSLYEIARRFDVTIDDIVTWNSLDPNSYLQPGQALTLYLEGG